MTTPNDQVRTLLDALTAQRAELAAKSQPLRDKRAAIQEQVAPMEASIREITEQIAAIEGADIVTLDKQIGQLHRALGARSLSASPMGAE